MCNRNKAYADLKDVATLLTITQVQTPGTLLILSLTISQVQTPGTVADEKESKEEG